MDYPAGYYGGHIWDAMGGTRKAYRVCERVPGKTQSIPCPLTGVSHVGSISNEDMFQLFNYYRINRNHL